jgi:hypothetical protein
MKRFQKLPVGKILVGIFAIGASCIIFGFSILFIQEPSIDELILHDHQIEKLDFPYNRPFLDPLEPIDLIKTADADEGQVAEDGEAILPYSEAPLNLQLQFVGYVEALGGKWRGNSAEASIVSPNPRTIEVEAGNSAAFWGRSVPDTLGSITPFMKVEIPINEIYFDAPVDQRYIQIELSLDMTYPVPGDGNAGNPVVGTFVNRSTTLEHAFKIYILTPEETDIYYEIREEVLAERLSDLEKGRFSFFIIGPIGLGIVIIFLVFVFSKISNIKLDWNW